MSKPIDEGHVFYFSFRIRTELPHVYVKAPSYVDAKRVATKHFGGVENLMHYDQTIETWDRAAANGGVWMYTAIWVGHAAGANDERELKIVTFRQGPKRENAQTT